MTLACCEKKERDEKMRQSLTEGKKSVDRDVFEREVWTVCVKANQSITIHIIYNVIHTLFVQIYKSSQDTSFNTSTLLSADCVLSQ